MRRILAAALLLTGCNAIFGLAPTSLRDDRDGGAVDGAVADADPNAPDAGPCTPVADGFECTDDVCVGNGTTAHPPLDRGTPCTAGWCDGGGACVACVLDSQCGPMPAGQCDDVPRCLGDTCTLGPAPRDTFCNGFDDQCDGAGNCVDCTTSGGCGECCVCSGEVCIPA